MSPTRVSTDDAIRRWRSVWLGPRGWTLPFHAKYQAWVLFFGIFFGLLLIEGITPLPVSVFPTWEFTIALVVTTLVSGWLDHDKPLSMVLPVLRQRLRAPRRTKPTARRYKPMPSRIRIKEPNR
jgi:hypothetical protein